MGFFDFLNDNQDNERDAYESFLAISNSYIVILAGGMFWKYHLKGSDYSDNDIRIFNATIIFGILVGAATRVGKEFIPEEALFVELEKAVKKIASKNDEKLNQKQVQEIVGTALYNQDDEVFQELIMAVGVCVCEDELSNFIPNLGRFYEDKNFLSKFKSKII